MGINKFSPGSNERPFFHSTGYARAAHGTNFGAASKQTFNQRHHIERNRQAIGRYRDSMVAGGPGEQERESQIATNRSYGRDRLQVESRGGYGEGASPQLRPTFVEPPARKYNPYA